MMKLNELLIEVMDYYYQMFQLPIFLCNKSLHIELSSKQFITIHKTYFEKFKHSLEKPQPLYFILEENLGYIIVPYNANYLIIGPTLFSRQESIYTIIENSFTKSFKTKHGFQLPYLDYKLIAALQLLYLYLFNEKIDFDGLINVSLKQKQMDRYLPISKKVLLQQKKMNVSHSHHMQEKYLRNIHKGNIKEACILATQYCNSLKESIATTDINLHKSSIISLLSLVTYTVIQQGVAVKEAYSLQDAYLMKLNISYSFNQHYHLLVQATAAYCKLIQDNYVHAYPTWVKQCITYIDEHIYEKISLQMLAQQVYLTSAYISVKFKEITGVSLVDFINKQKIEEASFLLISTTMSITVISEMLSFSNVTYFSRVFKRIQQLPPLEYRHKMSI